MKLLEQLAEIAFIPLAAVLLYIALGAAPDVDAAVAAWKLERAAE